MKTDFTIRQAQQSDAVELKELFQNTVIVINRRDYSQVEVEDWASCGDDLSNIEEMIKTHYFIVAVNQQSQIVGFSSITPHGYLHSMFVHKDFQGKGIATMLLEEIERYAITTGIMRCVSADGKRREYGAGYAAGFPAHSAAQCPGWRIGRPSRQAFTHDGR